jgi:hypothetical protein
MIFSLDIFIILAFFALVIGFIFIYMPGNYLFKFITVAIAVFISVYMVYTINQYKGYPVDQAPTHKVKISSIQVVKPDYRTVGGIYIWVFEDETTPRAYRLPYTEGKGKNYNDLKKKLENGYELVYNPEKNSPGDEPGNGKFGNKKGKNKKIQGGNDAKSNDDPSVDVIDPQETILKKEPLNEPEQ